MDAQLIQTLMQEAIASVMRPGAAATADFARDCMAELERWPNETRRELDGLRANARAQADWWDWYGTALDRGVYQAVELVVLPQTSILDAQAPAKVWRECRGRSMALVAMAVAVSGVVE